MALEVPRLTREPNWLGPMGRVVWEEEESSCCSRRRTILSNVLLTTLNRCIERQLRGWVYVGLLAFGMGTTVAVFHLVGRAPDRSISVYISPMQVGWALCSNVKSPALIASGPVADWGGAFMIASVTSWGRIGGISGERWGRSVTGAPVRW